MDRCGWAGPEQIYLDYHDTEWGVPEYDGNMTGERYGKSLSSTDSRQG